MDPQLRAPSAVAPIVRAPTNIPAGSMAVVKPRKRRLAYALTLSPLLLLGAAAVAFDLACEDGWCSGARYEIAGAWLATAVIVAVLGWLLLRRPIPSWAAGFSTWCAVFALACLVVAASQAYERDLVPAAAGVALGALFLVATWLLAS